jgi:cell division septum initiation protein DivIVA
MDVLRILDDLNTLIVTTPKHFGPITWGLNRDEITMQITKIRASLPNEVKAAAATVRDAEQIMNRAKEDGNKTLENAQKESERILAEARKESERILDQARLQQDRMIDDSEILKLSKAQSEEVRNAAQREATQMRRGAEQYAHDVLSQLEGVVGKVMTTIERGKQEMVRPEPISQAVVREKVRAS